MDFFSNTGLGFHTLFSFFTFSAGLLAIATPKGSLLHKLTVSVFILGLLYVIIVLFGFMLPSLSSLLVLLYTGIIYMLLSALSAVYYQTLWASIADWVFICISFSLAAFSCFQCVDLLLSIQTPWLLLLSHLLLALIFCMLLFKDVKLLPPRPAKATYYLKRTNFRMTLALGFVVMILLHTGLEYSDQLLSTVIPLSLTVITAFLLESNLHRRLLKKSGYAY